MRPMPNDRLERMRQMAIEMETFGDSPVGTGNGFFAIQRKGAILRIVASQDEEWEHVSISLEKRCPTWEEMCFVKDLFWAPDECVMQLHPPKEDWVNNHPYCLHLWKPIQAEIPRPPALLVGKKSAGVLNAAQAGKLWEEGV